MKTKEWQDFLIKQLKIEQNVLSLAIDLES